MFIKKRQHLFQFVEVIPRLAHKKNDENSVFFSSRLFAKKCKIISIKVYFLGEYRYGYRKKTRKKFTLF